MLNIHWRIYTLAPLPMSVVQLLVSLHLPFPYALFLLPFLLSNHPRVTHGSLLSRRRTDVLGWAFDHLLNDSTHRTFESFHRPSLMYVLGFICCINNNVYFINRFQQLYYPEPLRTAYMRLRVLHYRLRVKS
jgi:uncharacterized membrane protein AbrB (regulator of aidB expression)